MNAVVFLLQSTEEYDGLYTYKIPDELEDKIKAGDFVNVPFGKGNRTAVAVVESLEDEKDENTNQKKYKLKEIGGINGEYYCFTRKNLEICEKIHDAYLCTRGAAAKLMIPPTTNGRESFVKTASLAIPVQDAEKIADSNELRNINQIKIIQILAESGPTPVTELLRITGAKTESAVESLKKKGYIDITKEKQEEIKEKDAPENLTKPLELNDEQQKAYDKASSLIDSGKFAEMLLLGVTSGGKTEVYMHLVDKVIKKGGKAIILVPEISLTPQMVSRFTGRFGSRVAVFHSRLSEGEKKREWLRTRNGEADIVIGARSAVFAPFEKTDLYIIDEEQEWTYKSEENPRYHAAEVAAMMAQIDGATVIYGSATPSVRTFYRAQIGEIHYAEILKRATSCGLPTVRTVDMRQVVREGNTGIFSAELYNEMKKNLENGEQTVIFVQRRGYSRYLICEECGKTMICGKCRVAMTVHEKQGRLICHYCGNTVKIPYECPGCKSDKLKKYGVGTERVEEELKNIFPGCSVVRMDTDTTSKKNGHGEALEKFGRGKADFLVGTQMIAKGHDFPGVTLVGIISADSVLNIKDYTAAENAFQLITQVCGRAGRGEKAGRVVIQAYNLDAYALTNAVAQDYFSFYKTESEIRRFLNYPPYCAMGTVIFTSEDDRAAFDRADASFNILCKCSEKNGIISADILGPARCPMPKIKDRYRWRITVKAAEKQELLEIFKKFNAIYGKKYGFGKKETVSCYTEV